MHRDAGKISTGTLLQVGSVELKGSFSLPHAQEKAEGEPEVKKGKTLLDDASDEDNEEGGDESLEEVRGFKCLIR